MSKDLIIHVSPSEIAIALLEDKNLVELTKEKKDLQFSVGDIYLGKVRKIMAGLNAGFINVGYEKDAFLHYLDLGPQFASLNMLVDYIFKKGKTPEFQIFKGKPDIDKKGKITTVLKEGQNVLVQITKEPISTKGPRLSSEISIPGRNLVLIPFSDRVSISQRIESYEERNRLKQLIKNIKPNNYGVIVRTAAQDKKVIVLDQELRQLVKRWEYTVNTLKNHKAPSLVLSELSRTSALVRDILNLEFNSIIIDDENLYNEVKGYLNDIAPDRKKILKHYSGKTSVFEHHGVDKQIKSLFGRIVPFRSGAYLIVEHTEALHVIDVNSGNRAEAGKDQEKNALETNLAAAAEIARQLRLRDMGGIIVIDFIDMQMTENKQLLFEKMKEIMLSDRAKHSILPLSKFGLMQITRQRVRPETNIENIEKCPTCKGSGDITPSIVFTDELESRLVAVMKASRLKKITLQVHPYVAAFIIHGIWSLRRKWNWKYGSKLEVEGVSAYGLFEYRFIDKNGDVIQT